MNLNRRRLAPSLLGLVLAFPVTQVAAQPNDTLVYSEDFETGVPEGWWPDEGWSVVQTDTGFVYRGDGNGHAHSGYDATVWGDSRLRLRLNLAGDLAHVSYRHMGASRYFLSLSDQEIVLNKQTSDGAVLDALATAPGIMYGEWHVVEVEMVAGVLRVRVDEVEVLSYVDDAPLVGGGFSFESFLGEFLIDDLEVYAPATPEEVSDLQWIRTGGPLGGLGYDIRMHPDNPDLMYVTDAFAGVFRSTDGGNTWTPINEGITTRAGESGDAIPVFCLTIDPDDHDTIWIGTEGVRGVFRSTDGGDTWVKKDNGIIENQGITFRGLAIEPGNSSVVYAAAEVASWVWNGTELPGREFDRTQGVVYKTTDAGENWSVVWRGDNLARYVLIDPRDTDVVYVSTGIFDREAANSDPGARVPGGEGVIKSTDGGLTWNNINTGLGNLYVGSLFMHPENPDVLLAGTGNIQYYEQAGVYLSTNGGATWQRTLDGDIVESVEFSASNPDMAYAGNDGACYRSSDGGRTWALMSGGDANGWGPFGVRAGFPIDFQLDPRDSARLFANNYGGGNFLSTDGGKTWAVASKGYTGAQTRGIAVDPTVAGTVYAAARSGLYGSADGGSEWVGLSHPPTAALEWQVVAVDPSDANHLLAANNWHGMIWESRDRGASWRAASESLGSDLYFRSIAFAPSDPSVVYAGSAEFYSAGTFDSRLAADGVFMSRDGGATWSEANDATSADAQITALAISSSDPNVVYAASGNRGVLKTINGGQSWTSLNSGLPPSPVALSIAVHPTEASRLFAGLEFGGIYGTEDGGVTWQIGGFGMEAQASVSAIVFDPSNAEVMYVSDRSSGVYRSDDGGGTWQKMSSGLRTRAVNALAVTADGGHLYAATEGEGVFRLDLNGSPPAGGDWPDAGESSDDGSDADTSGPDEEEVDVSPDGPNTGSASCGSGSAVAVIFLCPVLLTMRLRPPLSGRRRSMSG